LKTENTPTTHSWTRPSLQRLLLAVLGSLTLLGGCGGSRDNADGRINVTGQPAGATSTTANRAARLALPTASLADVERCKDRATPQGLVGWRWDGAACRHSFRGLDASAATASAAPTTSAAVRRRILASLPTPVSVDALFNWAEVAYQSYFPSSSPNQTLAPYVYRYYPETGNHLAVSDNKIYVQGPISGGDLLYVGTIDDFTCQVSPQACAGMHPCAAPSSWSVGASSCAPNVDQPGQIPSGSNYTFVDTTGVTLGSASYACADGTLSPAAVPACEPTPPRACNTHDLQWTVGDNSCHPDEGQATQLTPGSSYTFSSATALVGSATYRCDDGLLVSEGAPTCAVPTGTSCSTAGITWTSEGRQCVGDVKPGSMSHGSSGHTYDTAAPTVGHATLSCSSGVLTVNPVNCIDDQRVADSFGGDGGSADGGASGDGTAADGEPIVGGLVRILDLKGNRASATTDANGYFRVRLTGMTPPLLVSVIRPDGKMRRSISLQAPRKNGYIFIAVTGLTDKLVSDVAAAAGFSGASALTPDIADRFRTALTSAVEALRNDPLVRARLRSLGIDPATFDPLSTPFRANGKGYDALLDKLIIETDETGATTVRSADCQAPASWTVDQTTCTPDSNEERVVPSGGSITHRDSNGSTRGGIGYACSRGVLTTSALATCTGGH
jgi:hypothetical protein